MAFNLGMTVGKLVHGIYYTLITRVDDLDLDTRSQWVGRGNKSALNYLDNYACNKH